MRSIHPDLFTRLMRLPSRTRVDLLEFIGATPVPDMQLEHLIDMLASPERHDPQASRLRDLN